MNTLFIRANMLKDRVLNKVKEAVTRKECGMQEVVLILIIIAVAAGVIGAFYIWAKGTLLPAVETSINTSIQQWFDPN